LKGEKMERKSIIKTVENKMTRGQEGRLNGLAKISMSLRGAKRRSNLIQNKECANDKIANKGNIMRLRRSLRSLAMTEVNKDKNLMPYCLSALVPNKSEGKKAGCQEDKLFNKSCHPEFISGSVHSGKRKLLWSKMLKHLTDAGSQGSFLACSLCKVQHDKCAFTLAEVLITLGIIGVVAALTIPTMVSNYRKRVVETKLQRVYSVMNQAVRMSVAENGDPEGWETLGNSNTTTATYDDILEWYKKYLGNYLKVSKLEQQPNSEYLLVHFNDGSVLLIKNYIYDMQFFTESKYANPEKSIFGVNTFVFRFSPNSDVFAQTANNNWKVTISPMFAPYSFSWDGTLENLKYSSSYGCYTSTKQYFCAKLIQMNGWKIPKDYPFKF